MKVDTVYASSHSVSRGLINTSGSSRILVGKYQSYESWGMVKFSLPDSLANVSVTDVKLTLRAGYHFGDSTAMLSFDVLQARRNWLGDSLTLDSLKTGDYNYPSTVGSLPPIVVNDSDNVPLSLDTTMVRIWFANIPDTNQVNNGIILRPTNTDVINGLKSFSSSNSEAQRPRLTVHYVKNGVPDTIDISSGLSRFVANISPSDLIQNPERIYVQAGIAYNGYVSFISTAPVPSKASIHNAELELVMDQGASRLNPHSIDSLVAYYVTPSGVNFFSGTLSDTALVSGQKVYRFQIQSYVQEWVRGATASVALFTYSQAEVLDLFTFFGENASKELRPKVIVTYSPTHP